MRKRYFILLQIILLLVVTVVIYKHQDKTTLMKTPPVELAKWYKPVNKRQVWLHNMFKLRREMQAVALYANQQDSVHMQPWVNQLSEHYLKIADMVPSWQKKLATEAINDLKRASKNNDFLAV